MITPPPPVDSLVAIDVGNTRIGIGLWDADGLHDVQRVDAADPAAWDRAIETVWAAARGPARAIVSAAVSPTVESKFFERIAAITGESPQRIRADIPLPMPIDVENPREVGVDRVCSAAAAHERLGVACAVASLGTAITVDFVSAEGHFLGGTILPGLEMSLRALHAGTAALPHVALAEPPAAIGRNTHDAIMSGVVYGAIGALREIVERFATQRGAWPTLIATGGNAPMLRGLADFIDVIVPDLCLMGVALAYRRAAGQP